MKWSNL